jgi:transcriptional regulator NrdR family protein
MQCPRCSGTSLRILQSRHNPADVSSPVIRQRECRVCLERWFTAEVPIPSFTVFQRRGCVSTCANIVITPSIFDEHKSDRAAC